MNVLLTLVIAFVRLYQLKTADRYFIPGSSPINMGFIGANTGFYYTSLIKENPAGNFFGGKSNGVGLSFFSPCKQFTIVKSATVLHGTFNMTPGAVKSASSLLLAAS